MSELCLLDALLSRAYTYLARQSPQRTPVDKCTCLIAQVCRRSNVVRRINEVILHRARLVLGWLTILCRVFYHLGM